MRDVTFIDRFTLLLKLSPLTAAWTKNDIITKLVIINRNKVKTAQALKILITKLPKKYNFILRMYI